MISSRSFEFHRGPRCDGGILFSLGLRSTSALPLLLRGAVQACFCGLNFGMRLEVAGILVELDVLFDNEGREGAGEPDDCGCETQSSDNESSQACSIVI